jgi:cytoskeletal protein RodZ
LSDGEDIDDDFEARVGERLAHARERRGLTLAEVAESTRIPLRHLKAIEGGDYASLPAPTYSAGFVKVYAKTLGLDPQSLSHAFRAETGHAMAPRHEPAPYEPADPARTPPRGLAILVVLICLVAGIGYLYWRGTHDNAVELASASQSAPPAAAAPPPPVAAPQAAPVAGAVTVAADGDVWMKIAQADGKVLFMGVMKQGDSFAVPPDAVEPILTTGRPGLTRVTVGTSIVPPLGNPDRMVKDVSLKPDALLARVTATPAVQPPANATTPVENIAGPA